MASYLITLIGDDRVGIVEGLADVIRRHGGNWERSELAELGGKFAGIVLFTLAAPHAATLIAELAEAAPGLDVSVHEVGTSGATESAPGQIRVRLELIGNDRPGIVAEITAALRAHEVTIDRLETEVTEAPMSGGQLFSARADVRGTADSVAAARTDLEALAAELMVEVTLGDVAR